MNQQGSLEVKTSLEGAVSVYNQLKLLALTPRDKKRYIYYLGKEIEKQARRNQRAQKDVDGKPWPKRKDGKKKMMRRLLKPARMKVISATDKGVVTWRNALNGVIAYQQQNGLIKTVYASRSKRNQKCTKTQAKELMSEGYRKIESGGRKKRVSIKYLTQNMSMDQAGVILRDMRGESETPKTSWKLEVTARSFLGADEKLRIQMGNTILKLMDEKRKYAKKRKR